ncbi:MAG: anti-sigma factor domain-containing protein [Acidimicrobiales bacterium]
MNTGRPNHQELQELLAAFALDAVGPEEASVIEEHLRDCSACRAEVAAHRETATLLADSHLEPPPELWDRVAARIGEAAPPLDTSRYATTLRPRDRRSRPSAPIRAVAAAAAIVAVVSLGALAYQQRHQLGRVEAEVRHHERAVAALTAFNEPTARHATLRSSDGSLELRAVVLPDGTGYLLADRLPSLPGDRTYQLWAMIDGTPHSAGVLGPQPDIVTFTADDATTALAISEEDAGGAAEPALPATLTGLLDT